MPAGEFGCSSTSISASARDQFTNPQSSGSQSSPASMDSKPGLPSLQNIRNFGIHNLLRVHNRKPKLSSFEPLWASGLHACAVTLSIGYVSVHSTGEAIAQARSTSRASSTTRKVATAFNNDSCPEMAQFQVI